MTRPLTIVLHTLLLLVFLLPRVGHAQSPAATPPPTPVPTHDEHAGHGQQGGASPQSGPSTAGERRQADLPSFIPTLTDADRQAAFPDLGGHPVSNPIRTFVLVERLEWQASAQGSDAGVHVKAWVGRERNRLWLRGEGASEDGRTEEAQAHVLWGRQVTRWWDVVGGIRQDLEPGDAQTWAAIGLQGLAPYWFDIEATGYVGAEGRTQLRVDADYDLLLTNRWILQPRFEVQLAGKADVERQTGAGLMTTDVGLRLRYEIRRELAPYAGVMWRNKWQRTAELAEEAGESTGGARFVAGLRFWW